MPRRVFLVVVAIGCLVAAGVLAALHRNAADGGIKASSQPSAANTPSASREDAARLPPVGSPLAQSLHQIRSEASAGNQAARARLFSDVATCLSRVERDANLTRLSRDKNWIVNNPDFYKKDGVVDTKLRDEALSAVEENIRRVESSTEMCAGAPALKDGEVYQFALLSAQGGDAVAASCLLMAPFDGPNISNEEAGRFGEEARSAAEAALVSGDWRLVSALRVAYSNLAPYGMASFIDKYDVSRYYQYTRLQRYAYPDGSPEANQIDQQLAAMLPSVPEAKRNESDAWAKQMYREHFFLSDPAIPNEPACPY